MAAPLFQRGPHPCLQSAITSQNPDKWMLEAQFEARQHAFETSLKQMAAAEASRHFETFSALLKEQHQRATAEAASQFEAVRQQLHALSEQLHSATLHPPCACCAGGAAGGGPRERPPPGAPARSRSDGSVQQLRLEGKRPPAPGRSLTGDAAPLQRPEEKGSSAPKGAAAAGAAPQLPERPLEERVAQQLKAAQSEQLQVLRECLTDLLQQVRHHLAPAYHYSSGSMPPASSSEEGGSLRLSVTFEEELPTYQRPKGDTLKSLSLSEVSKEMSRKQQKCNISALQALQGWKGRAIGRLGSASEVLEERIGTFEKGLEFVSGMLILFNTIYMVIEVEVAMASVRRGEATPEWIWWGGLVFTVLFSLELLARIANERRQFIAGSHWQWNVFDSVLVLFQVVDMVAKVANLSFFRGLRAMRAFRAVRVLRTARYVRELRLMVSSISCSLYSIFWSIVLLCLVLLFFAMAVQQTVQAELEADGLSHVHPDLLQYYRSLPISMLSLFMAISGGCDWKDLLEPLAEISRVYMVIFTLFVTFLLFGMLNILTAIFVESTCKLAEVDADLVIKEHMDRDNSAMNKIRNFLRTADVDGSGTISQSEFESRLDDPAFKAQLQLCDLNIHEARGIFQLLDVNEQGDVGIEEFVYGLMRLKGGAKQVDIATMMYENKRVLSKIVELMEATEANFADLKAGLRIKPVHEVSLASRLAEKRSWMV